MVVFFIMNIKEIFGQEEVNKDTIPSSIVKDFMVIKLLQNTDINEMAVVTPTNDIYLDPNKAV